jgi:hypothetical protein
VSVAMVTELLLKSGLIAGAAGPTTGVDDA